MRLVVVRNVNSTGLNGSTVVATNKNTYCSTFSAVSSPAGMVHIEVWSGTSVPLSSVELDYNRNECVRKLVKVGKTK